MPKAKPSQATRRRDQRRKYGWLDQVKADDRLPRSAFVVAFELKQGFNAEFGGAAWMSIKTLAADTGLSEPSIVRITRQLVERGHLKIDAGKAGRGSHTNRYFMVNKTSADGGLETGFQTSAGESQTSAGGVDSIKTLLREAKASRERERERSLALAVIPQGAPAPDGGALSKLQACLARLLAIWQRGHGVEDEAAAWKALLTACSEGDDPVEIAAAILASGHRWFAAYQKRDEPDMLKPLWKWISLNQWKNPPPQRKPQRNGGKVSLRNIARAQTREDSDR
jgi:Helix-turn-helix domain